MSTLRLSHIKKTVRDMNIPLRIKIQARKSNQTLRGMSIALGMNPTYLSVKGVKHHFTCAELLALSIYMDCNLFDWFMEKLPADIRATKAEKQLLLQIEEMKKQLLQLIEERNMFRDAVLRK